MGNKSSSSPLSSDLQKRLLANYDFDEVELLHLWGCFNAIGNSVTPDGVIDKTEFEQSLGYFHSSLFARRLFDIFDCDGDGVINFEEFVSGLSQICSDDQTAKIEFSFRLYDFDDSKSIEREELYGIVKSVLFDTYLVDLSEADLQTLVSNTFAETDTNNDGKIDLEEYGALCAKYPNIIKNFTFDRSVLRKSNKSDQAKKKTDSAADESTPKRKWMPTRTLSFSAHHSHDSDHQLDATDRPESPRK